jgi:hypothetical protein
MEIVAVAYCALAPTAWPETVMLVTAPAPYAFEASTASANVATARSGYKKSLVMGRQHEDIVSPVIAKRVQIVKSVDRRRK